MASSTLLVTDLDRDAPKTAMVGDQGEPHHERRGRLGRPARAAHRVLATEAPRDAEQAGQRSSDDRSTSVGPPVGPACRCRGRGRRRRGRPVGWPGTVSPTARTATPTTATARPDDDAPARRLGLFAPVSDRAATGGMRTARRAGLMADEHGDTHPDDQGGHDGAGARRRAARVGRVIRSSFSRASSPTAASTPRPSPTSDGDESEEARLEQHRAEAPGADWRRATRSRASSGSAGPR